MSTPRTVLILGSTGSVGTQALDVIRRNRDRFQVVGLGAGGRQLDLLQQQAAEFGVQTCCWSRSPPWTETMVL